MLYFKKIIADFESATNCKFDRKEKSQVKMLIDYLKIKKELCKKYNNFLQKLNINFDEDQCVEINTGIFDSVVLDNNTNIISPYVSTIKNISDSRKIEGEFIAGLEPCIYDFKNLKIKSISKLNTFMMQNAKSEEELSNWDKLSKYKNIILGAYGKTYDKDKALKVKLLRSLKKELLCENFLEEYVTSNNDYYYVIASKKRKD